MAVAEFTTWADTTEQTVLAAACRVTAVEIWRHPQQVNEVYLQLFNATNPTPGVTAPNAVLPIGAVSTQGAGTHSGTSGSAEGGPKKVKYVIPGGFRFGTACTAFCSTTATGATAATTTSLPGRIRVYYVIG